MLDRVGGARRAKQDRVDEACVVATNSVGRDGVNRRQKSRAAGQSRGKYKIKRNASSDVGETATGAARAGGGAASGKSFFRRNANLLKLLEGCLEEDLRGGDFVVVRTDGASRGNPGDASIGVVIENGNGHNLVTMGEVIGTASCNEAEYQALDTALDLVIVMMGDVAGKVRVFCDSQLLVRHVTGAYEARAEHLVPRIQNIKKKAQRFSEFSITHVMRSENKEADSAANRALDECSALVITKRLLKENDAALRDAFSDSKGDVMP